MFEWFSSLSKPKSAKFIFVAWVFFVAVLLVQSIWVSKVMHDTRMVRDALYKAEAQKDSYDEEWRRLQIEEYSLTDYARIEKKANAMGLIEPKERQLIFLSESEHVRHE